MTDIDFSDLDGDGTKDLLAGSYSVSNGLRLPDGTDDGHCYLYALSHEGKLLWRRELCGYYTRCIPFCLRLEGENSDRLFVVLGRSPEWAAKATDEIGRILRLNNHGEIIAQYDVGAHITSHAIARIGKAISPSILATDVHGNLHVLDPDLRLMKRTTFVTKSKDLVETQIAGVCDVNGDGCNEIVLQSSQKAIISGFDPSNRVNTRHYYDNCVLVLDAQLKVLDRFLVFPKREQAPEFRVIVKQLAPQNRPQIIILAGQALILEWADKTIRE